MFYKSLNILIVHTVISGNRCWRLQKFFLESYKDTVKEATWLDNKASRILCTVGIAHEISSTSTRIFYSIIFKIMFDTQGGQFNKNGILEERWTQCLVAEYGSIRVPELVGVLPDHINGSRTLSENMADNDGLGQGEHLLIGKYEQRYMCELYRKYFLEITSLILFAKHGEATNYGS